MDLFPFMLLICRVISKQMLFYVEKNVGQQAHVLVTCIALASEPKCDDSNLSTPSQASSHTIRWFRAYTSFRKLKD